MKKFLLIITILLFVLGCKTSPNDTQRIEVNEKINKIDFPKPLGLVSDFDKVFTKIEIEKLSKILSEYQAKTTNQIAIVSISENLDETNFDQYALDLSNNWGVGTSEKNNGLTIIFSKQLRKIRISTGTGTENILTDDICEKVLNEKILPEFIKGNYYLGIENGLNEFIKLWK